MLGDNFISCGENNNLDNEQLMRKLILFDDNGKPFLHAKPTTPVPKIITISETLFDFGDVTINSFSSSQNYTVSGSGLNSAIIITAPTGFIINTDDSNTNQSPISLTPSGGIVNSTTIYVKANPTAVQFYGGNITHVSTGATTQNLSVEAFGPATELWFLLFAGGANSQGTITEHVIGGATTLHKSFDASGVNASGNGARGALCRASNGKLYGMTEFGGANNVGVIFDFDMGTNTFTKLYDFVGVSDVGGARPHGTLIEYDGVLWGMTRFGGSNGQGNIFTYDYNTSTYTNRFSSAASGANATGGQPYGRLLEVGGLLYGLFTIGGASNVGTLFSIDPVTFTFTNLVDFTTGAGGTGTGSQGSLIVHNGLLYGLQLAGAANGFGCIFSYNIATDTYTVLKSFVSAADGSIPRGELFSASNGKLYGMTSIGGTFNGTLFEYDTNTSTYTVKQMLRSGVGQIGGGAFGSLVQGKKTKLYGLCTQGGSANTGSLIEYDLVSGVTTNILDLVAATTGSSPQHTFALPTF